MRLLCFQLMLPRCCTAMCCRVPRSIRNLLQTARQLPCRTASICCCRLRCRPCMHRPRQVRLRTGPRLLPTWCSRGSLHLLRMGRMLPRRMPWDKRHLLASPMESLSCRSRSHGFLHRLLRIERLLPCRRITLDKRHLRVSPMMSLRCRSRSHGFPLRNLLHWLRSVFLNLRRLRSTLQCPCGLLLLLAMYSRR